MDELEMQEILQDALTDRDEVKKALTFETCGILSYNKGLVVRMDDGSEFQITIVQSK